VTDQHIPRSDPYRAAPAAGPYPPPPADQQDTAVFVRPLPPNAAYPQAAHAQPGAYPPPGNPQADYWEARFRRQRRWTRVLAVVLVLGVLGTAASAVAAWQLLRANPLASSVSELADGLGLDSGRLVPGPEDPPADEPGQAAAEDLPIEALPIPQEIKDLAATLGITDAGQLLDLAVANGLMSAQDAERLRAAIRAGTATP
jgi:hypothetical protein